MSGRINLFLRGTLLCVLSIFVLSCREKEADLQLIRAVDCAKLRIDVGELVDSISYYPLETNEKCLIGWLRRAVLKDDHIFVQDDKQLYAFDSRGKFVGNIGRIGNGPGEYIKIDAFYIDEEADVVGVVHGAKECIMYYDYKGKYLYSLTLDKKDAHVINKIQLLPDGRMIAHYVLPGDTFPNESIYKLFTVEGDSIVAEPLCGPSSFNLGDGGLHPWMQESMVMYKGKCLTLNPVSLDISCFDGNALLPKYRVDMGKELPDAAYIKTNWTGDVPSFMVGLSQAGKSFGLIEIHTNGKYVFLKHDFNGNTCIWDGDDAVLLGSLTCAERNVAAGGLTMGLSPDYLGHHSHHDSESNPVLYLYHFRDDLMDILKSKIGSAL